VQAIATDPDNHCQVITAYVGKLDFEANDTVDDRGQLLPGANPWASALWEDLEYLAEKTEDGAHLMALLDGRLTPLFGISKNPGIRATPKTEAQLEELREINELFTKIDMSQLRARYWSQQISPVNAPEFRRYADAVSEDEAKPFACDEKNDDGSTCGLAFSSYARLMQHIRHTYKLRNTRI